VIKSKLKIIFKGVFAAAILATTLTAGAVFAVNQGGRPGSGGISGCGGVGWTMDTCYGATWRYYDWPAGATSVTIKGKNGSGFADGTTITKCEDTKGYYRYAMVAYNSGYYTDGTMYNAGDQVGVIGIDKNNSGTYDSEFFGGGMNYIGTEGEFNEIRAEYNKWKAIYPDIFWRNWGESSADDLSWFCGNPLGDDFYAVSNVSNGSGYVSTGITNVYKSVRTNTKNVQVGSTVPVTFSHNVYASAPEKDIKWEMRRTANGGSGISSTSQYTVAPKGPSSESTGQTGGSTNTPAAKSAKEASEGGIYIGDPRNYTDGGYNYIVRDQYDITFNAEGTYDFCEGVSIDGEALTQVCTKIVVGAPQQETGVCELWTPADYATGTTSVVSKVLNNRLTGQFGDWQGEINGYGVTYAKPTDIIAWQNCYYPGVQKHYNKDVIEMNGVIKGTHSGCCSCNLQVSRVKFQNAIDSTWSNKFRVTTTSPFGFNNNSLTPVSLFEIKRFDLAFGNTDIVPIGNNYGVKEIDDVGKIYQDEIFTPGDDTVSPITTTWSSELHTCRPCCGCGCCTPPPGGSCCGCCTTNKDHSYEKGTYSDGSESSEAEVWVPYNFTNTASLSVSTPKSGIVFSGERIQVRNSKVDINTKQNSLTEDNYATQVDNARVRLIAYVSDVNNEGEKRGVGSTGMDGDALCGLVSLSYKSGRQCEVVEQWGGKLNADGRLEGSTDYMNSFNGEYNSFDAVAGDYMCFAIAVYPYTSAADTHQNRDMLDANGSKNWYVSQAKCAQIAKRPTFQIYGGSLYSAGSIGTSISAKRNIYGTYGYHKKDQGDTTVFGSWVEQSVTTLGVTTLLASGAGTGYSGGIGIGSGHLEGGNVRFCENRTTLSLANYGGGLESFGMMICPFTQATGMAGIRSGTVNKESLVDFWLTEETKNNSASMPEGVNILSNAVQIPSATGVPIFYTYRKGNLSLSGAAIPAGRTHIVKAEKDGNSGGNLTINGNITYPTTALLSSAGQIPKVVIYAAGDINIACGVGQIDAILIAEGNVNTCPSNDENDPARSRQLNIRGMIISDTLDLNRTYGTAMGRQSATPAETINYDTSAILWGRYMAGAGESDTLTVTYQHELAPRY